MTHTVGLAAVLACAAVAAPASAQLFDPFPFEAITSGNRPLVIDDFDQDGIPDVILSSLEDGRVSLYVRDAAGSYVSTRTLIDDGRPLTSVSVADADGDGDLDLFAIDRATSEVLVYPNAGGGPLGAPIVFGPDPTAIENLVLADIDVDGDVDLITGGRDGRTNLPVFTPGANWIENRGGLVFSAPAPFLPPTDNVRVLIATDADGDGDDDLIVRNSQALEDALLLRNEAGASFTPLPIAPGLALYKSPLVVDLDGDGIPDIASLGHSGGGLGVQLHRGLGGGAFAGPLQLLGLTQAVALVALDADGDLDPDLLAFEFGSPTVWRLHALENLGGGSFASPTMLELPGLDATALHRLIGDLSAEGSDDLLLETGEGVPAQTLFLAGPGAGSSLAFIPPIELNRIAPGVRSLAVADLDGDGALDYIASGPGLGTPRRFERGDTAFFPANQDFPIGALGDVRSTAFEDLDGDGQLETLAVREVDGTLFYLDGIGTGAELALTAATPLPTDPVLVDFDQDGDTDIFWRSSLRDLQFIENLGSGAWAPPSTIASAGFEVGSVEVADLDGDALLDVCFCVSDAFFASPQVSFALGQTGGGVGLVTKIPVDPGSAFTSVHDILVQDADFDGDLDILAAHDRPFITASENLGGGMFGPTTALFVTAAPVVQLEGVAFFNTPEEDFVSLDEMGSLHGYVRFSGAWGNAPIGGLEGLDGLTLADVRGDGDVDLIGTRSEQGDILVFDNPIGTLVGSPYCRTAVPNSTGVTGKLTAEGSAFTAVNAVEIRASDLPPQSFGYFLTSQAPDDVFPVTGSLGRLCLGGSIGRFAGPGQIQQADAGGSFALQIDLTSIPQPTGQVVAQPGEQWFFQAWHRDSLGGTVTSNFTEGLALVFR